MSAPSYTLGKWRTRNHARAKLSPHFVKEFRRFAQEEGFSLPLPEQIRALQSTLYGQDMSALALREILLNKSWYDPHYVPGQPSTKYWGELSLPFILMLYSIITGKLVTDEDPDEITWERIESALNETGGNKKAAAKLLGIHVRSLYRRLDS